MQRLELEHVPVLDASESHSVMPAYVQQWGGLSVVEVQAAEAVSVRPSALAPASHAAVVVSDTRPAPKQLLASLVMTAYTPVPPWESCRPSGAGSTASQTALAARCEGSVEAAAVAAAAALCTEAWLLPELPGTPRSPAGRAARRPCLRPNKFIAERSMRGGSSSAASSCSNRARLPALGCWVADAADVEEEEEAAAGTSGARRVSMPAPKGRGPTLESQAEAQQDRPSLRAGSVPQKVSQNMVGETRR